MFFDNLLILLSSEEIWSIAGLSLFVSISAVLAATIIGIPLGIIFSEKKYRNNILISAFINTGMGLPPVLIGLVVFMVFTRNGPFGDIRILFTPMAMIVAQFILTIPIIIGTTKATLSDIPVDLSDTLRSLGATNNQINMQILIESRIGILTGITLALGRAFSEVGAIIIVGGNIRYRTRVLTTAIITEVSKGEYELALALGLILLTISFLLTSVLTSLQIRNK